MGTSGFDGGDLTSAVLSCGGGRDLTSAVLSCGGGGNASTAGFLRTGEVDGVEVSASDRGRFVPFLVFSVLVMEVGGCFGRF